jgi:hypothetical protein
MSDRIQFIAVQSFTFSNARQSVFLRIDGNSVTQSQAGGSGTVNCQSYGPGTLPTPEVGNYEAFELIPLAGGVFAIRSVNFPTAFLRIDGSGVTASQGGGVGTVNCQYYASGTYPNSQEDYEVFSIPPGPFSDQKVGYIESTAFSRVFLRMDGSSVNGPSGGGSGNVNGQFYPLEGPNSPNDYEALNIIFL